MEAARRAVDNDFVKVCFCCYEALIRVTMISLLVGYCRLYTTYNSNCDGSSVQASSYCTVLSISVVFKYVIIARML